MKFFVTDAQLAALRVEIADEIHETYQQNLSAFTLRHDTEIERLREDRAAELARVVDPSTPFVAHLKEEVAFWRLQFLKERQRAELAIDACRVQHSGVAAVAQDLRPQGEGGARTTQGERDIFSDPEMAALGLTEGVG